MMIFSVLIYRCIVSFATTNDLTHPTNEPLATISKVFFYLIQLPIELAICWNHAITDYRTVVDAGARGDGPRKELEDRKKKTKEQRRSTPSLKDIIVSKVLLLKRQHRLPDAASDIIPLTRTEASLRSQTSTIVPIDAGDAEKRSLLSIPSTSSRSSILPTMSTDADSISLTEKKEKGQWLSFSSSPLVEDVPVWTPRRSIRDW